MFIAGLCDADTWTVDDDGKADFNNIQAAIDAASDGDEIIVYAGTYTGSGDSVINMNGKSVWLHSSEGPEATIINGENARRVLLCHSGETTKTIIEGLTITGGFATGKSPASSGAGISTIDSSPVFINCVVTGNVAEGVGGGVDFRSGGGPVIRGSTITNNSAEYYGGGVNTYWCNAGVIDCTISNNIAAIGAGGISSAYVNQSINNCIISNNISKNGPGGGVIVHSSDVTVYLTTVCSNTPDQIYGDYIDIGSNAINVLCLADCPDLSGDGIVDVPDLLTVVAQWGEIISPADVNADGIVDVVDLLAVMDHWGPCPSP